MMWAVGIDPDKEKSGVAFWNMHSQKFQDIVCWDFPEIIEKFRMSEFKSWTGIIRIEAGHLIKKSNWDARRRSSYMRGLAIDQQIRIFEKEAKNVGQNNMVGELLVLYLRRLGYKVEEVSPLGKKQWDTNEKFKRLTGSDLGTNQEKRDAGMLVYQWKENQCPPF